MEAIILIGLQAAGKSSFYRERLFSTHVRISLDLLRTRHRERAFLAACVETQQPFVIDNTNPTREERAIYIETARNAKYSICGFYFCSRLEECLPRNQTRAEPVPEAGLYATAKKLELPAFEEGFDSLAYVRLTENGFLVEEWNDEI